MGLMMIFEILAIPKNSNFALLESPKHYIFEKTCSNIPCAWFKIVIIRKYEQNDLMKSNLSAQKYKSIPSCHQEVPRCDCMFLFPTKDWINVHCQSVPEISFEKGTFGLRFSQRFVLPQHTKSESKLLQSKSSLGVYSPLQTDRISF